MKQASNGQIWKAKKEIGASQHSLKRGDHPRRFLIETGEMVEFRFWSPATFRTIDGHYLQVSKEDFYENFEYVGTIFHEVYSRNNNTTKEILDARLYKEEKE